MIGGPIFTLFDYLRNPTPDSVLQITMLLFALFAVIFILLPFHEFAHAITAYWLGDNTANEQGRLTLNPIRHIDPMGMLFMLVVGFGWAKPVPVNPLRCTRKLTMRGFMSITAAAGPISNILFALVTMTAAKMVWVSIDWEAFAANYITGSGAQFPAMYWFYWALMLITRMSIYLAVFNLIPIPPLDGSKIMFFFLNNRQVDAIERNMNMVRIALLVLILAPEPFNVLGRLIWWLGDQIMRGLDLVTFFIR
jgi:Zn-dependent protease